MYSQNGYQAGNWSLIATYTIPETNIRISLRKGDCSVVLLWLASQFHQHVQPLTQADTGGYVVKGIEGGRSISNHASGTAMDLRWNLHPMGKRNTFNVVQRATIHSLLKRLDGVVRWGGDYVSRADDMHFEVIGSPAAVRKVADKIRSGAINKTSTSVTPAKTGTSKQDMHGMTVAEVKLLQSQFNKIFPSYPGMPLSVDGVPGPKTVRAIMEFQDRCGLKADGEVGPRTRAMLKQHHVF